MKIRKTHAAWAVKVWVLISVFLIPFVGPAELVIWGLVGAAFAWVWRGLPEEPEAPVEPLPFAEQYKDRQIPRPEDRSGPGA